MPKEEAESCQWVVGGEEGCKGIIIWKVVESGDWISHGDSIPKSGILHDKNIFLETLTNVIPWHEYHSYSVFAHTHTYTFWVFQNMACSSKFFHMILSDKKVL